MEPAWTLFLDRDGVINKRNMDGYITNWSEFIFEEGALSFISETTSIFKNIVIVTNQQGVGKGLMSQHDLDNIHSNMCRVINQHQGRIDHVFSCTCLATDTDNCRKPSNHMAFKAKEAFPDIVFDRSVMVGDSVTDMQFGQQLGMKTLFIHNQVDTKDADLDWIRSHCWSIEKNMTNALERIKKWHHNER